ncbi:MAG TPA: FAD-dependent oxidoreductase [Allosphingosinicella sp.]|jgi:2-polyprenyl-6-methoxyphenol hydroxylase-like FAD-dependent oxidoreductase
MGDAGTDIVIAGGGPAGMVAGLLFARAGLGTMVLEKHGDFLRDFRGDTVHPSTLRIFHELGLLDRLLERPHDKVRDLHGLIGGRPLAIADFSHFDPRWNFIAMMPQWEFLDFVAGQARLYPHFTLSMDAEATGLVEEQERVAGVRCRVRGEEKTIRARLTIAADGRSSRLRAAAGLAVRDLGAPIDVFWFRVPRERAVRNETTGVFASGRIMALIDRGDYWQCAYVFPKGMAEEVRARGIRAFRDEVAGIAPMLRERIGTVAGWDDVKLLTVALDRLERWHRPGLLVIGDAAHAMSPVGGVGINVAVQDAVAAANALAGPMAAGEEVDPLLGRVERKRLPAVRITQGFQRIAQQRIISPLLMRRSGAFEAPRALRWLDRHPVLRRIPAALIGFGWRAEHVRSPSAKVTNVP